MKRRVFGVAAIAVAVIAWMVGANVAGAQSTAQADARPEFEVATLKRSDVRMIMSLVPTGAATDLRSTVRRCPS